MIQHHVLGPVQKTQRAGLAVAFPFFSFSCPPGRIFLKSFFISLLTYYHWTLHKNSPTWRRQNCILHVGQIPQIEAVFGPPSIEIQGCPFFQLESLALQRFVRLYLRRVMPAFLFLSASRRRRSFCAQAGQYFAALDAEKIGVLQSRHRFPGVTCITSAYSDGSAGRTARRRYLQIRDCDRSWGQMQASPSSRSRQFP